MSSAVVDIAVPEISDLRSDEVVASLLEQASQLRASDLLFAAGRDHVCVSVRHLGSMRPLARLSLDLGLHCVAHFKVRAGMDPTERRRPQDDRSTCEVKAGLLDLRVSTLPTLHGEDCALPEDQHHRGSDRARVAGRASIAG